MGREAEGYRDQLEDILDYFGGKRLLTISDVARYLGRKRETVAKHLNISAEGITAPMLARKLVAL